MSALKYAIPFVGGALAASDAVKKVRGTSKNMQVSNKLNASDFGLPSSYQEVLDSNPYSNYTYQNGFWDRLGDAFGFRTVQDSYREQMEQANRDYISQLSNQNREEDYNTPAHQASLQRAAGLNPDLTGVSGDSSASENNELGNSPISPQGINGMEAIQNIGGSIMSIVSSCIGISSGLEGLKGQRLANESSELDLVRNIFPVARDYLLSNYSDKELSDAMQNNWNLVSPLDDVFKNGSLRSKFGYALTGSLHSFKNKKDFLDTLAGVESSRRSISSVRSQPYYTSSGIDYSEGLKELSKYMYDLELNQLKFNNQLFNARNARNIAGKTAEAEDSSFDFTKYQKDFQGTIEKSKVQLLNNLKSKADKGDKFSSLLIIAMGALFNGQLKLPSIKF